MKNFKVKFPAYGLDAQNVDNMIKCWKCGEDFEPEEAGFEIGHGVCPLCGAVAEEDPQYQIEMLKMQLKDDRKLIQAYEKALADMRNRAFGVHNLMSGLYANMNALAGLLKDDPLKKEIIESRAAVIRSVMKFAHRRYLDIWVDYLNSTVPTRQECLARTINKENQIEKIASSWTKFGREDEKV